MEFKAAENEKKAYQKLLTQNYEFKAAEYEKKAHHKLLAQNSWLSWFDSTSKQEAAVEYFIKAANMWIMSKNHEKAAQCFLKSAEHTPRDMDFEIVGLIVKAAQNYKKVNSQAAIHSFAKAITIYLDKGKFGQAAKFEKEIAELLENENMDMSETLHHYLTAAEYFELDNLKHQASVCLAKAGDISAALGDFSKAYTIFDNIGSKSASETLLKWVARDFLLKAILCLLAQQDSVGAKKAILRYSSISPEFKSSREEKFAKQLVDAVENNNIDKLTSVINYNNQISPHSSWMNSIFVTILEKNERR